MKLIVVALATLLQVLVGCQSGAVDFCTSLPDGLYAYPLDCSKFYHCSNGYTYIQSCPALLEFSTKTNNCQLPIFANCAFTDLIKILKAVPPCLIPGDHQDIADSTSYNQSQFDFIVVGAGVAGSVIASRLTENPSIKVLLLETGGPESCFTDVPAMDIINTLLPSESSKYTTYMTPPQTMGGLGFPNEQVPIVVGTVMGGGSTVNGMMMNRGGANDFNGWAQDFNCTGWSYEDVLPFFLKSEDQTDPILQRDTTYHSTGGPLTVSSLNVNEMCPPYALVSETLLKAYSQMGYNQTDWNGPNPLGTTRAQRTISDGKRESTSKAFLEPVFRSRPNLQILTQATVTKINFNGATATGVTFTWKGAQRTANVSKEVILSAGAIGTPKILLLSGVGPANDLAKLKIPLVADLPVGQNFQDHVRVGGANFNLNKTDYTYFTELIDPLNWLSYSLDGTGPLSNDVYFHQPSFLNIRTDVPDRGFLYGPADLFISPCLIIPPLVSLSFAQHQISPLILLKYYLPNFLEPQLNMFVTLNYVKSRGYVKLQTANPADQPIVNPQYFTDPDGDDLARALQGMKLALNLTQQPALKALGITPFAQTVPGCEGLGSLDSDDYLTCVIQHLSASELHPCCSARMAGENDPTAVVDPRLKVIGVNGLRVADASVMPFAVSANLMAATIMIGEKAAYMILEDYGYPVEPLP